MKTCALTIIFIVFCFQPFAQDKLRNGIFLHHSTGLNIWGPNGSNTTVTDEVNTYNKSKGLTDNNKMSLEEKWFGDEDNEWYIIRDFFEGKLSTEKPIDYYYENYKIINDYLMLYLNSFLYDTAAIMSLSNSLSPKYRLLNL